MQHLVLLCILACVIATQIDPIISPNPGPGLSFAENRVATGSVAITSLVGIFDGESVKDRSLYQKMAVYHYDGSKGWTLKSIQTDDNFVSTYPDTIIPIAQGATYGTFVANHYDNEFNHGAIYLEFFAYTDDAQLHPIQRLQVPYTDYMLLSETKLAVYNQTATSFTIYTVERQDNRSPFDTSNPKHVVLPFGDQGEDDEFQVRHLGNDMIIVQAKDDVYTLVDKNGVWTTTDHFKGGDRMMYNVGVIGCDNEQYYIMPMEGFSSFRVYQRQGDKIINTGERAPSAACGIGSLNWTYFVDGKFVMVGDRNDDDTRIVCTASIGTWTDSKQLFAYNTKDKNPFGDFVPPYGVQYTAVDGHHCLAVMATSEGDNSQNLMFDLPNLW
ncbi:hypothetical protein J8273_7170 [Carpediemonas membranifera]|uniref:Uncharacterized protein n=1 Tax=Carpediemonas membranifera TaxID=201153 RepID=A0A8J6AS41_9EUKA|nr:hypothetical protein J8273_7170 [Carpediemonas membranifera]|eukprot:KAG9390905.1 hypothetical protein J8273_7170 [Carpediemonas membranifera]